MSPGLFVFDVDAVFGSEAVANVFGGAVEVAYGAAWARNLDQVKGGTDHGRPRTGGEGPFALELGEDAIAECVGLASPVGISVGGYELRAGRGRGKTARRAGTRSERGVGRVIARRQGHGVTLLALARHWAGRAEVSPLGGRCAREV